MKFSNKKLCSKFDYNFKIYYLGIVIAGSHDLEVVAEKYALGLVVVAKKKKRLLWFGGGIVNIKAMA